MERRNFLKMIPVAGAVGYTLPTQAVFSKNGEPQPIDTREFWVSVATRIIDPVFSALSQGILREKMPVETKEGQQAIRMEVSHLEAFARSLAGISPWLELGSDGSVEGQVREKYIAMVHQGIDHATNPLSPDYMNFTKGNQPLVDAAFLAQGLIRAPKQLWISLPASTKNQVLTALKLTRAIKPVYSNWLLFSAIIEAFFLFAELPDWDPVRIDYAIKKHMDWYVGDGLYSDGSDFHLDYYNSFVIQPMLIDVVRILTDHNKESKELYQTILKRAKRYAIIQERLISPEGTFPPIGRSLAYRFGAFHLLAQLAYMEQLPALLTNGQVRNALSAVISKMIEAPGTFDSNGWLTIGFSGHQPAIGEDYISTGSLYLCTVGLLPLGLFPEHTFWTSLAQDWTSKKAWAGNNIVTDKPLG